MSKQPVKMPDERDINFIQHFHSRKGSLARAANFKEDQHKMDQSDRGYDSYDWSEHRGFVHSGHISHPQKFQSSARAAQCYCAGRKNN